MTTINYNGQDYNCLEHMKEIKETGNGQLFKKYYNKKQMFKDLLGVFRNDCRPQGYSLEHFKINPDKGYKSGYKSFGKVSGFRGYSGSRCYVIEIYKLENITEDISSALQRTKNFFVKDDNGQVWFIYTNVD